MTEGEELEFLELSRIKNWRRVLSNFYEGDFEYNGLHYRSAEHAFQGRKIAIADEAKGELFALESGSEIALGDGEIARKNRKLVVLSHSQLIQWDTKKGDVLRGILRSKFSQVILARTVLLATKCAQLWHGARGIPNARQFELEEVRTYLNEQESEESLSDMDKMIADDVVTATTSSISR